MFELTNAQKAEFEENVLREFQQKRYARESDIAVHERMKIALVGDAGTVTAAGKEISNAKRDLRHLDIAIAVHSERYEAFRKLADAEETPAVAAEETPTVEEPAKAVDLLGDAFEAASRARGFA